MKHLQTYESFKKIAGQKISVNDFKKIRVGKPVLYMGSHYKVIANDGYVLKLKGEDGDIINVNLGQFNHGGQINESTVNESEQYAVVLTGGSVGDRPRPRDAKGYVGMDASGENLYTKDKAKAKAARMNKTVLSPGEKKYYKLKYIIVPVKDNKFIKESSEPLDEAASNEGELNFRDLKPGDKLINKFRKGKSYLVKKVNSDSIVIVNPKTQNVMTLTNLMDYQLDESVNEAEEVKKAIHDHWKELYGEDFISEYPKVAKILKNRPHVDRRELGRIWDEVYGEDFKEKYPGMWDRMEEAEEISERNAFLVARAKAIEEDLEEFEFNGKMYPVLNKSK